MEGGGRQNKSNQPPKRKKVGGGGGGGGNLRLCESGQACFVSYMLPIDAFLHSPSFDQR